MKTLIHEQIKFQDSLAEKNRKAVRSSCITMLLQSEAMLPICKSPELREMLEAQRKFATEKLGVCDERN